MQELGIVDHLNHPLALRIQSLLDRDQRTAIGQMIIDDEENILQALSSGLSLDVMLTTDKSELSPALIDALSNTPIVECSKRTIKKIFQAEKASRHFALAKMPQALTLSGLAHLKRDIIVLDQLTISGNVGAIIRTSVAFNADAIVLLNAELVDIYDRRVIRASRGFVFSLPVISTTSQELIAFCKSHHMKLVATASHAQSSIEDMAADSGRLAIVFGSEKGGCHDALFEAADLKVRIPLNPAVESLNVSAAASIALYLRDTRHRP